MTPRFLREEAVRFRGMAEATDREASKSRLLAMASDYDAQAEAADGMIQPNLDETTNVKVERTAIRKRKGIKAG